MGIGIPNSDLHKIDCFTKSESNFNSIINNFKVDPIPSSFLRVTTSHFSGVVTRIYVSYISYLESCISPVNSFTIIPKYFNLVENFSTISDASAFIGEI